MIRESSMYYGRRIAVSAVSYALYAAGQVGDVIERVPGLNTIFFGKTPYAHRPVRISAPETVPLERRLR